MTNYDSEYISRLIYHRIVGDISSAGERDLEQWASANPRHAEALRQLTDPAYLQREWHKQQVADPHRALLTMQARLDALESPASLEALESPAAPASSSAATNRQGIAHPHLGGQEGASSAIRIPHSALVALLSAAATALVLIGAFTIYNKVSAPVPATTTVAEVQSSRIAHGTTRATLTLEDGDTILLGSNTASNAKALAKVSTANGKKILATPRGGEFKVTLEDGTEVWLNAQSTFTYPDRFDGDERHVAVTGEAYFKVAKDAERPFYVETDGQLVRVYGTEFNIHSYPEDARVATTLVEGSIALSPKGSPASQLMLTPGHQATFDKQTAATQVKPVDTSVVTSWRSGQFVFEDQTLAQIMQTLSRWYDFDYRFADQRLATTVFMGSVPRYGEFSDVLTILEKSGGIHFRQNGRTITVY